MSSQEVDTEVEAEIRALEGKFEEIDLGENAEVKYRLASRGKKVYNNRNFPFLHKNFPPENEVHSEAHRLAVWWASRADVQAGDQTLISTNDRWYLVEKFDDSDNYYQVEEYITKQEFEIIFREIKKNGRLGKIQSILATFDGYDSNHRSLDSFVGREPSFNRAEAEHRREGEEVVRLDQDEAEGRERSASDGTGDREGGSADRQGLVVKRSLDVPGMELLFLCHRSYEREDGFNRTSFKNKEKAKRKKGIYKWH